MDVKWLDFLMDKIPFGGNLSLTLALTVVILFIAFLLGKPFSYIVKRTLNKIGKQNIFFQKYIVSQIEKPIGMMSLALIWLIVLNFMPPIWKSMGGIPLFLSKPIIGIILVIIKVIIGSGLVWIVYNMVDVLINFILNRYLKEENQKSNIKSHFLPFISRFIKIVVLCFGGLLVLQSLGVNVVSLMAGLGLGGVAIALAAKDSASNILSYVNIMLDRPFSVGDWIAFNNIEGTVTEVGIRSAKIKTFYDSIITIPNSVLTNANIDNLGKRKSRRTRVYLGVEYNTSPEKIEKFIAEIKQILMDSPAVKKDYFQVYFTEFGASELKIITNFFLIVNSWEDELEQKQNIFMAILKLAKELDVNFAFPTQTIHVDSMPPQSE